MVVTSPRVLIFMYIYRTFSLPTWGAPFRELDRWHCCTEHVLIVIIDEQALDDL